MKIEHNQDKTFTIHLTEYEMSELSRVMGFARFPDNGVAGYNSSFMSEFFKAEEECKTRDILKKYNIKTKSEKPLMN